MWICDIFWNPKFVIFWSKKFYLTVLLALYHTLLTNHKIVIWRLCRWWQLWVRVKICIKTIAYSRCTFLPTECFCHTTLHPHNVSSFYSNLVQYKFSHPTLCIYYSKIRHKDLTYVPYLPTHFIIFTYSHALTHASPPTYYHTLCFQKHQHSPQNNSLLWQMLPTKLLSPWQPTPYGTWSRWIDWYVGLGLYHVNL